MGFNFHRIITNQTPTSTITAKRWCFYTLTFFLLFFFTSTLLAKKNFKPSVTLNIILGIKLSKDGEQFNTFSLNNGVLSYDTNKEKNLLKEFSAYNTKLKLFTYPQFFSNLESLIDDFEKFIYFGRVIDKYLNILNINQFRPSFNIVVIPNNYKINHESNITDIKNSDVVFDFETSLPKNLNIHSIQKYEDRLVQFLSHELFHFLVEYADFGKMKLIRNETYASLFGACVAYELVPNISDDIVLNFPEYFFENPLSDFKQVRKKIKKDRLPPSASGNVLSRYYFQAVANNRTGENISSDKIPKFCHKLFSEHNFKHPIEKKPPVWFKDFLVE